MPLPTDDVNELKPPKLPEQNSGGLPPAPPGHAPAAGEATEEKVAQLHPPVTEDAPKTKDGTGGAPPAPFARGEASESTDMAETSKGGGALQAAGGPAAIAAEAAELGFEGVDLTGFGVFPIVSLQKETFKSTEGDILGSSFKGYCQGSRKKWIYKNGLASENPDSEFFYTYDDELTIRGEPVEEKLAEWRAKGWAQYIKNPYLELMIILAEGEKQGQIVALSIPKTSISRFSNFWVRLRSRGIDRIKDTLCEFGQGKEITGPKIKNPWIPLDFRIVQ